METLHTVLLGPYKYLLRALMSRLTTAQKDDLQAHLVTFDFSGLNYKLSYNLTRHFRSFVGRDFKALAQVSLFLLGTYMTPEEKNVWLALSKVHVNYNRHVHMSTMLHTGYLPQVFRMAYCNCRDISVCHRVCEAFVQCINANFPDVKKKVKVHLILHLTQSMTDFGPTSTFNTERHHTCIIHNTCKSCYLVHRCETYNSLIRARNIYANRLAPSRDIAYGFATLNHSAFSVPVDPWTALHSVFQFFLL